MNFDLYFNACLRGKRTGKKDINGIEVDKLLLENGKIGNFYIEETDTG